MALGRCAALQSFGQRLIGLGMQGFDDVAVAVAAVALITQMDQLPLQRLQLGQTLAHMAQMRVQRVASGQAIGLARAIKRQQGAHFV